MTFLPVHPLEQSKTSVVMIPAVTEQKEMTTTNNKSYHQQRAYSVTAMPSELQKSVKRHEEEEQQQKLRHNQPWWQYYYQLYHYQLPPGRKPTVFGPYLLLQTLGEGEFGKVKFGIEVKTGQEVAIKLIRKDSIDSSSRMTKVEREISVLRILHHPNIVELFDVIETEKYIGIILQCATGGELFDYILAHRYLKERDASRLFAQLISGVHYMHQKHIVHRDLKLENLLLDRHRNVLITDFGFANQFSSAQDDLMSTSCGSPCYAAPELVMNQGVYVGPAVDIWSCGVILFAMLCGYLPYDDDPANPESYNINLLYKYILNTPLVFPDYISDEACDLLSLMLVPDPEKRCSMETIMNHPWLSPHQHLFSYKEKEEEVETEEEVMMEDEEPIPDQARRNTIATIVTTPNVEPMVTMETTANTIETIKEQEDEAVVPEFTLDSDTTTEKQEDEIMQDTTTTATTTDGIISIQLPPPTIPNEEIEKVEKDTLPPLPLKDPISIIPTTKTPNSTVVSSSTEKVLHFLSGHTDTTTPKSAPSSSTNEKRTRHMSLVNDNTSILQAKFLSSIHRNKTNSVIVPQPPTPNSSASTPHPTKKTKARVTLTPTPTPPISTRRKTLSLLVNSMTDNKMPFSNRRQSKTPPAAMPTPEQRENKMMPSVSEHTMNTLLDEKEKHRSAGKKLMDWFKKKPLSTIHRSTTRSASGDTTATSSQLHMDHRQQQDASIRLRIHHGAVDQEALTSRSPSEVFSQVKQTLKSLGLEFKRDGSEYKLKCARPKKPMVVKQQQMQQPPFRALLRRPSGSSNNITTTIYGDPNVDPGDEVRFSVELCKIKNLPGLYIVDMRRMRGNVWAYKFIYRTLLDTLNLGGKAAYLKTTTEETSEKLASTVSVSSTAEADAATSTSSTPSSVVTTEHPPSLPKEITV